LAADHRSGGDHEAGVETNVYPLPVDWLGPRDQLVPFGRDADEPLEPPSAQSFWTEDAASLHHALSGADVSDQTPFAGPRRSRRRLLPAAAVAAALIAVIAIVGTVIGPAGRRVRRTQPPAQLAVVGKMQTLLEADALALAHVKESVNQVRSRSVSQARSRAAARHRSNPRRPNHARHTHHRAGTAGTAVSYHAPISPSSGVVSSQPSAAAATTTYRPAPILSAPSAGAKRDTSQTSTPSPASLLGPGHCACG
jgi:hypothetical protein